MDKRFETFICTQKYDEKSKTKNKSSMIFRCDMCQYRGTGANLLRMHMRRMHPEHTKDLRICEICNHKTRSADDMQKHVKLFHPEHCYARDKEQSKQHQMKKYAVHAIYVRFSMADLSIAWKSKSEYENIISFFRSSDSVSCSMCDKTFRHVSQLYIHFNDQHTPLKG